jgi:hypothetical protein
MSFTADVFPVPPFAEDTVTLLVLVPAVVPVTVTVTVQMLLAAIDAPLRLILEPFGAAVTVPPEQVVEALGTAAFCKPVGYVSVKLTPVNATVFEAGLVIVKIMVVVPLIAMVDAVKDLLIDGAAMTVTAFVPVLFPSLISSTLSLGSTLAVFERLPEEVGVTGKLILKEEPIGKLTAPTASQLRDVPVMEQLIVPVGGVAPLTTVRAPCG